MLYVRKQPPARIACMQFDEPLQAFGGDAILNQCSDSLIVRKVQANDTRSGGR